MLNYAIGIIQSVNSQRDKRLIHNFWLHFLKTRTPPILDLWKLKQLNQLSQNYLRVGLVICQNGRTVPEYSMSVFVRTINETFVEVGN